MSHSEEFVNLQRYELHEDLIACINNMRKDDRDKWQASSNLGHILSLKDVKLHWDMLQTLVQCWDPVNLIFKFGDKKLTPTLEEFAQITNLPLESELIVPFTQSGYNKKAWNFFGVKGDEKFKRDNMPIVNFNGKSCIPISYLLDIINFSDVTALSPKEIPKRHNALDLAVVGNFLFSNHKSYIDLRLCDVIKESKTEKGTMVPLILGEMIRSLCDCKISNRRSSLLLQGPIAVLQIWAFEHFQNIIGMKDVSWTASIIDNYTSKQNQITMWGKKNLYQDLYLAKDSDIVWRCYWFYLRPVFRIGPSTRTRLLLPSMEDCVSYNPIKAVRQLGLQPNDAFFLLNQEFDKVEFCDEDKRRLKDEWKIAEREASQLGLELCTNNKPNKTPIYDEERLKKIELERPSKKNRCTTE